MTPARRGRVRKLGLPGLLLLVVFGVYAATAERQAINTDAYAASVGAWRIAAAGTPWLDGLEVRDLTGTHGDAAGAWLFSSANGHVNAQRMAGPILAGVPFYWLLSDGADEPDFQLMPGAVAASTLTALSVVLLFSAMNRQAPTGLALAGSLVFAFATPTWSVSANGLWTHTVTQFGIAGAAYAASRGHRWWLAGVFLGIGMFGRPHIAVVATALGLGVAWSRRDWRFAVSIALPTLGSLGLLTVWNRIVHGPWSLGGAYTDAVVARAAAGAGNELGYSQLENYLGFLVSFDRGFLVWSPLILLFIPAFIRARRALPDWTLWLALGGIVYTFLQLRLNHFSGGAGFYGYRHGLELLTCLLPALTFATPYLGRVARLLVPVVVAIQFAVFTIGAVIEGYFVQLEDVWRDNSFWLALRHNPGILGTWLAICVGIGVLLLVRHLTRFSDAELREHPGEPSPADSRP